MYTCLSRFVFGRVRIIMSHGINEYRFTPWSSWGSKIHRKVEFWSTFCSWDYPVRRMPPRLSFAGPGFASCIRWNASGSKHLESRMGVNYVCDHWNSKTCYPKGSAFAESARHIRDMCSCLLSCWRFCWPSPPCTWFGGSFNAPVRILWMSLFLQLQNGKMFNSWTLEALGVGRKSIDFSTERKYQRGCGLYMNYKPLPCPTNKKRQKSLARNLVFRISA